LQHEPWLLFQRLLFLLPLFLLLLPTHCYYVRSLYL
jgi:hypothetical protein